MRTNRLPSAGPARTTAITKVVTTLERMLRELGLSSSALGTSLGGFWPEWELCATSGSLKMGFRDHRQERPMGLKCRFLGPVPDLANRISPSKGLHFNKFLKLVYCKIVENHCSRPPATQGPGSSDTSVRTAASQSTQTHTPKKLPEG